MDISSTTSSAVSTADTNTSSVSQSSKTSKGDTSFKEEMSKAEKQETPKTNDVESNSNKNESKNDTSNKSDSSVKNHDNNDLNNTLMLSGEINILSMQNISTVNENHSSLLQENIQTLMDTSRQLSNITTLANSDITSKVDYSTIQMSSDDAVFFADLVQDTDKTLQNVVSELQSGIEENVQQVTKNVKVSSTLMSALSEAVKTNQPLRIDFDKDVSVIIKVDKDGTISAKFIPGDKAVEEYLKQNISFLKNRFDEQEISYKDLSYSRQQQRQNQNRRNNKENDHE